MTEIEEFVRRIVREELDRALSEWTPRFVQQAVSEPRDLLSLPEAAAVLGVAEATLRDWRVDRKGPRAVKVGRLVKYHRTDLEQWVQI